APRRVRGAVAALVAAPLLRRGRQGQQVVLGRRPANIGILRRPRIRHLCERHVLGEPTRGQTLRLAGEECQQRTPGGIGTRRAAREEYRDAGPAERLLEMRAVLARRAEEDRDAVERHAARRRGLDATRDLDALAGLPGPGVERDAGIERGRGRDAGLEEV